MEDLLARVTQQAMNYAIRSGITITATYALRQSTRLLKVVESKEKEELQRLQERLESKIRIISPAIDMIELISARGNTSLESAVNLTQSLRWDIQSLGNRLTDIINDGNEVKKGILKTKAPVHDDYILRSVITQIKALLTRIEDAVPLINLAITTSGVNLSASLPATVSPSRLLQASTFLTAGDSQYSTSRSEVVQIGPTFTLSLYMLFLGNVRPRNEAEIRSTTWKEVIHKARVKLFRVPLDRLYDLPDLSRSADPTFRAKHQRSKATDDLTGRIFGEIRSDEFAYQILLVEDLDDGRVHTLEGEDFGSAYGDVQSAGIRDVIPVHEISKIFYADTGKILNIGNDGEANNPVLLLKRDVNAIPPRRMVERLGEEEDALQKNVAAEETAITDMVNDPYHSEAEAQLQRESRASSTIPDDVKAANVVRDDRLRIPANLDPEWLAFEVHMDDPSSDAESETPSDASSPATLEAEPLASRAISPDSGITTTLANLHIDSGQPLTKTPATPHNNSTSSAADTRPSQSPFPAIRTSLSLLETLLRLLSLQQFQQASHLAIPDELLNFFLSESATTGAATGDEATRRQLRAAARRRVGFDPYDESPIKRHGEDYQYRGGTSQAGGGDNNRWNDDDDQDEYGYGYGYSGAEGEDERRRRAVFGSSSPTHTPKTFDEGYETYRLPSKSPQQLPSLLRSRSREFTTPDGESSPSPAGSTTTMPLGRRGEGGARQQQQKSVNRTNPKPMPPAGGMASNANGRRRESDRLMRKGSPLARGD